MTKRIPRQLAVMFILGALGASCGPGEDLAPESTPQSQSQTIDADNTCATICKATTPCESDCTFNKDNVTCGQIGTNCWRDSDGDGLSDASDNCISTPNPSQSNCDGDSLGDACDSSNVVTNDRSNTSVDWRACFVSAVFGCVGPQQVEVELTCPTTVTMWKEYSDCVTGTVLSTGGYWTWSGWQHPRSYINGYPGCP